MRETVHPRAGAGEQRLDMIEQVEVRAPRDRGEGDQPREDLERGGTGRVMAAGKAWSGGVARSSRALGKTLSLARMFAARAQAGIPRGFAARLRGRGTVSRIYFNISELMRWR
ncbi:hypothetical protein QWZ10_23190 [Paracoccus cavernae]|uniref:Uncharacterized protein n=1 Tax=Paracoccus cavernae TaxID=1571207 RepID=A0ABT8DC81_9RHOB|nr:hypothetical protein [Paracoccus cavernae]